METETEQAMVRQKLDRELSELHFTGQSRVLRRTHPRTWSERIHALWNKELELPLVPAGTVCLFFLVSILVYHAADQPKAHPNHDLLPTGQERKLIEEGGSFYWQDEFERKVAGHEDQNQS